MILGFTSQINKKPTYFVEKISKGLYIEADIKNNLIFGADVSKSLTSYALFINEEKKKIHDRVSCIKPKPHTIREDSKNRWKAGTMIDFFINCRQPNMFRFAPKIPVVSTQKIEIIYTGGSLNYMSIYIDNKCYLKNYNPNQIIDKIKIDFEKQEKIKELAINDGFDTIEDFFAYFNKDFSGKIIHWTDLKY